MGGPPRQRFLDSGRRTSERLCGRHAGASFALSPVQASPSRGTAGHFFPGPPADLAVVVSVLRQFRSAVRKATLRTSTPFVLKIGPFPLVFGAARFSPFLRMQAAKDTKASRKRGLRTLPGVLPAVEAGEPAAQARSASR